MQEELHSVANDAEQENSISAIEAQSAPKLPAIKIISL